MNALEHLAIAETALIYGLQTTASWVAIENIRRARDSLLRSNSVMPDHAQGVPQVDADLDATRLDATDELDRAREHPQPQ